MKLISHIKTIDQKVIVLIAILLGFTFLLFFQLGNVGLLGLDEPLYAEIAREMIELNDYVVSRFNYTYHFHKPPLLNWCQAACMHIFGVNELSVRLPSAIGAVIGMIFAGIIAFKIYSLEVALLTAIIMASSSLFIALSRFSVTDMLFSSMTNCSIISFFIAAEWSTMANRGSTYRWYLTGAVFLSLSFLSKGPAGIILVFGVLLPYLLWRSKIDNMISNEYFYLSFLLFLIITLPWFIVVHFATNGEFTNVFFIYHNFTRFTDVVSGHSQPIWYFVPVLILGFIPWTLFLPQTFKHTMNKKNFLHDLDQHVFNLFCVWWLLAIFIFFSISKSKLFTYMLPALTPMAILTAVWIKNIFDNQKEKHLSYKVIPLMASLIGGAVLVLFNYDKTIIQITDVKGLDIAGIATPLLIVLSIGMFLSFIVSFKNILFSFGLFLSTFFIIICLFVTSIFPSVDAYSEKTAKKIALSLPKEYQIAFLDARKYPMNFYAKRYIYTFNSAKEVKDFISDNTFVLLVAHKRFKEDFSHMKLYGEDYKYLYFIKSGIY